MTGSRKHRENRRKRESETEANNTDRNKGNKKDNNVENNEDSGGFFLTQDIDEAGDEGIENEGKDAEKDLSEGVEDESRAHPVEANTTTTVVKDVVETPDNVNEDYEEEPKSFETKDSTDSGIGEDIHPQAVRPVTRNKSSRAKLGPRNKSEMRAGMQKEYFLGLEHLRKMITGKSDF